MCDRYFVILFTTIITLASCTTVLTEEVALRGRPRRKTTTTTTEAPLPSTELPTYFGGKNAFIKDAPYMVIVMAGTGYSAQFCTGILVSNLYVVTTAHCVDGKQANVVNVYLGTSTSAVLNIKKEVDEIFPHPQYTKDYIYGDVALLKLEDKVKYTAFIKPIEIDQLGWNETRNKIGCDIIAYSGSKKDNAALYRGSIIHRAKNDIINCPDANVTETAYWASSEESAMLCTTRQTGGVIACYNKFAAGLFIQRIKCVDNATTKLCEVKAADLFVRLADVLPRMQTHVECLPKCSYNTSHSY